MRAFSRTVCAQLKNELLMKAKSIVLSFSERCRNILAANWEAQLNTIKADSAGSKSEIHTSKIHYMIHKSRPYLLIPEGDLHNTNTIIDERGSVSICSKIPGPLMNLLRSLKKLPARVALTGDVMPVSDKKVQGVMDKLTESIISEIKLSSKFSHSVSSILNSAGPTCYSRSEILHPILSQTGYYTLYKFEIGSCTYIDASGDAHDVENEEIEAPKSDLLLPFSGKLIDGINQSETRRRALMLFCFEYFNALARDALMLSIDHKGFDVLAKVPESTNSQVPPQYSWKEFRFNFREEAKDIESFCQMLVELEVEALQHVKSYSGLG